MVEITAELTSGTAVTVSDGRHTWRADEPPEAMSTDLGPNPYELLLGALAACTCITLSLYCRHKGMKLESVSASYRFDRVHAEDCEDCGDTKQGKVERITSSVRITGEFDDRERERLQQVAQRCPVHKTLANGLHIVDRVEFA